MIINKIPTVTKKGISLISFDSIEVGKKSIETQEIKVNASVKKPCCGIAGFIEKVELPIKFDSYSLEISYNNTDKQIIVSRICVNDSDILCILPKVQFDLEWYLLS